jgi:transcriptional regulator with XRE-family HTH domain
MQTIGDRLEEARKKKGVSIREAAEATKIRGDYLTKFESNQFDVGLTELYVRGFLRNYATFLKLPADRILNDYSALGHDQPKPRQPGREVYGRMEVSIVSAEDRADPAGHAPAPAPAPHDSRRVPHVPRSGGVSHGTALDPAVVFKAVKWSVIAVVTVLVLWGALSLFSGNRGAPGRPAKPAAGNGGPQMVTEPTITLFALDTVRVKVVQESDGKELFQGTLTRGESRAFPKHGAILVTASAGENLEVEVLGKRYPMPFKGWDRAKIN